MCLWFIYYQPKYELVRWYQLRKLTLVVANQLTIHNFLFRKKETCHICLVLLGWLKNTKSHMLSHTSPLKTQAQFSPSSSFKKTIPIQPIACPKSDNSTNVYSIMDGQRWLPGQMKPFLVFRRVTTSVTLGKIVGVGGFNSSKSKPMQQGPLHTRDWEPVTITLQALLLVEKAELVQVCWTTLEGPTEYVNARWM